ncbi:MAG: carboxylating nicotinate-nucleotide diphosphorylase [Pseudomonadota bacterium]
MAIKDLIKRALKEDLGRGDITTDAVVPAQQTAKGEFVAKEDLVVAGLEVAEDVLRTVDPKVRLTARVSDGVSVKAGGILLVVEGKTRSILKGERVALNFLARLCGIATLTRKYVERTAGTKAKILDTRKTAPLLRELDKYAVRVGGGFNNRLGLFDAVLIKDNHIAAMGGSVGVCVRKARERRPKAPVIVEITSAGQIDEAVSAGATRLLLDNMTDADVERCVSKIAGRVEVEVSGGITLERVERLAKLGVNFISVGALTHSPKAADISLELKLP